MSYFVHVNGLLPLDVGGVLRADLSHIDRGVATYVDKILKGTKPADIPVEQPIQLRTGDQPQDRQADSLTIPPNVLARAERVIK